MTIWKMSWLGFLVAGACTFEGPTGLPEGDLGDGDGDGDIGDVDSDDDVDVTPAIGRLIAPRVAVAPTTSEYVASEWQAIERLPVTMTAAEHKHVVINGYTEDAAAEIAAVHDDDAIYLLVELIDDIAFEGDGVEIYVDAAGDRGGEYGPDDYVAFVPTSGRWSGTSGFGLGGSVAPTSGDGFVYVLRIDKASMIGISGAELGFNIALYDDDDGSGVAGWGLWHEPPGDRCADCCRDEPHPHPWCDTSMLGALVLVE